MQTSHDHSSNDDSSLFLNARFDAVLFDLDGTLIHSTSAVVRAWRQWAEEEGIDPSFRETTHGKPASEIVDLLIDRGRRAASLLRILDLEHSDTADIVALPGAHRLLASLPDNRAAIVTSCTRSLAQVRIVAAHLTPPTTLVTYDDVDAGKPDPEPFLTGAARLGFPASRCLVVEDAPSGIASARAAGCAVVAIAGTHSRSELDADLVVDTLEEISFKVIEGQIGLFRAHQPMEAPA